MEISLQIINLNYPNFQLNHELIYHFPLVVIKLLLLRIVHAGTEHQRILNDIR